MQKEKNSINKNIKFFSGLLVTGLAIFWLYYSIEWQDALAQIVKINYLWLIPTSILFLLNYWFRAIRWHYLMNINSSTLDNFKAILAGALTTFILPFRIGEVVRPLYLSANTQKRFLPIFLSVVIERLFDLIAVLATFALLLLKLPHIPSILIKGSYSLLLLSLLILAVIILATFADNLLRKAITMFSKFLPKQVALLLLNFSSELINACSVLKIKQNLILSLIWTIIVWISCYLFFYCALFLFNVSPNIILATTIATFVALGVAAPSAPGFIGVYQAATVLAWEVFHLSKETAAAYSIVTHILQYIIIIIVGSWVLAQSNTPFSKLIKQAKKKEKEALP